MAPIVEISPGIFFHTDYYDKLMKSENQILRIEIGMGRKLIENIFVKPVYKNYCPFIKEDCMQDKCHFYYSDADGDEQCSLRRIGGRILDVG